MRPDVDYGKKYETDRRPGDPYVQTPHVIDAPPHVIDGIPHYIDGIPHAVNNVPHVVVTPATVDGTHVYSPYPDGTHFRFPSLVERKMPDTDIRPPIGIYSPVVPPIRPMIPNFDDPASVYIRYLTREFH